MNRARKSITSVGLALLIAGCGSGGGGSGGGSGGDQPGGSGGDQSGGSGGSQSGGSGGDQSGGSGGSQSGGSSGQAGSGGSQSGGSGGQAGSGGTTARGGSGGGQAGSGGATARGGSGGGNGGSQNGGSSGNGGTTGAGGTPSEGGTTGAGGTTATGGTTTPQPSTVVVTSASGNFWKTGTLTEVTSGSATVTVNDGTALNSRPWEGFGGSFNELGWKYLTSDEMKEQALEMLFGAEGANFTWGRIPMGASDYAENRYTLDDTGSDVTPDGSESNRPPADTSLSKFSLERDGKLLIPYIKAALKVKSDIRFWASPWTPPVWMKTGYKKDSGGTGGGNAKKPSYFDGGNFKNDTSFMAAYAEYYKKFVQGYKDQGINIELVSPQNEPGFDQNYPSCLWDSATYTTFLGKHLGPAMKDMGIKVMIGTMSNATKDIPIATSAMNDASVKSFATVVGVQWEVLDKVNENGQTFGSFPIWATEHKCGNYPWNPDAGCGHSTSDKCPDYNSTQAPNDMAYGVESWKHLRNAITKGKVTSYSAWNMVLDKIGLGNDTSRDWRQNALLVADGGKVTGTPAYYVFRHLAQYVAPGATVVTTSGGDAVAFKNTDGSIVAVTYNSGSANNNFIVKLGGKMFQFAMPGAGWATVKYKP